MQNKKSQAGLIILGFFLIIVIGIAIPVAYYSTKNKWFSSKEEKQQPKIPTISIFARVLDPDRNLVRANYFLDADKMTLRQGILEKSWNEFSGMPINKSYRMCYNTGEYYRHCSINLRGASKACVLFNESDKKRPCLSYANITMDASFQSRFKKGNITINSPDKIQKDAEQILRLNISSRNGSLSRLTICTWHSIGIIKLVKPEITIHCNRWLNYTFDIEGNQVNLTNNIYWCEPENRIEQCAKVINKKECVIPNIIPPSRLKDKVDYCYYTGTSIIDSDYIAEYNLETMPFINQNDYINFYIVDMEEIKLGSDYPVRTEDSSGNDVGIKDILYVLNYDG